MVILAALWQVLLCGSADNVLVLCPRPSTFLRQNLHIQEKKPTNRGTTFFTGNFDPSSCLRLQDHSEPCSFGQLLLQHLLSRLLDPEDLCCLLPPYLWSQTVKAEEGCQWSRMTVKRSLPLPGQGTVCAQTQCLCIPHHWQWLKRRDERGMLVRGDPTVSWSRSPFRFSSASFSSCCSCWGLLYSPKA